MHYPGFVGGSNESESRIADCERTVNFYPEVVGGAAKAPIVLYPAPGVDLVCTLPVSPFRGAYTLNGQTFAVGGDRLYKLNISGFGADVVVTSTELASGLNNPDDGPVTMASNGDAGFQLMISSGSFLYCWDLRTSTLTQIQTGISQVGFIDGFFIGLNPARSEFSISALEDGATWDPTQVAQRNDAADKWQTMLVAHKELWLFGSQTASVWYDAGLAPFPFAPNPSVFIETALAAPNAADMFDGAPIWLGTNTAGGAMVYRADGYSPRRVSNHALEYALLSYPTLVDAESFVYQESGHSFWVLTFPTAQATWVYDAATGDWHERGEWNGYTFTGLATRGHVYVNGAHLTGSRSSGAIYRMGIDLATGVDGTGLRRLRRAPHVWNGGNRFVTDRFLLDLETGLGLPTGQGSDPKAFLRWSNDGGHTFGSLREVSVGRVGQYRARAQWFRLGMARDRVYEFSCSDPIPWRLIDAYIDVRPAAS